MNEGLYTFTDAKGRQWDITLTIAGAKRISVSDFTDIYEHPIKILEPDKKFFTDIITNSTLIAAMVWAVVQPQVKKNIPLKYTDDETGEEHIKTQDELQEEFLEGFDGDAITRLKEVWYATLVNFFQTQREALSQLIQKVQKGNQKATIAIQQLDPEIDQMLDQIVEKEVEHIRKEMKKEIDKAGNGTK